MIIDHNHPYYKGTIQLLGKKAHHNGAFYYSKEIVKNIIPNVNTDRNWVTIRVGNLAMDHSIVFIHNNLCPERYNFLEAYDDLILVCGVEETCEKVKHFGIPLYLPLSVDIEYVEQFKNDPDTLMGTCYVGRRVKMEYDGVELPNDIDILEGIKRQDMLPRLAKYRYAYAVGRTAMEANILGCEVLPYDPRYPDPSIWKPLDNKDAAKILQEKLDAIGNI